jgi:protein-S-isoprenylcysteine O-methyltransferase Ste14
VRAQRLSVIAIPVITAGAVPVVLRTTLPAGRIPVTGLPRYLAGSVLMCLGLWMTADAVTRVYLRQDTPLGDKPPEYLVSQGWYRLTRNPMTLGITALLWGESILLSSVPIFGWGSVVFTISSITTIKVEEPSLLAVFGSAYAEYAESTPRWLPLRIRQSRPRALARRKQPHKERLCT